MSLDHHIEPIRMSAVLRRKAILQQYCSIEKPTAADAKRFADAMGLGLSRFTQMAKAWRTLPDVTTIQGATVKADRKPKLSKAVVDLLEATIARMGASTPATSIEREFRWACADRDLEGHHCLDRDAKARFFECEPDGSGSVCVHGFAPA